MDYHDPRKPLVDCPTCWAVTVQMGMVAVYQYQHYETDVLIKLAPPPPVLDFWAHGSVG